MAKKDKKTV